MNSSEDDSVEVPSIVDLQRSVNEIAQLLRGSRRVEHKQTYRFDLSRRSFEERQNFLANHLQFYVQHQKILDCITEIQKNLECL